jgi:hypothetical protein
MQKDLIVEKSDNSLSVPAVAIRVPDPPDTVHV